MAAKNPVSDGMFAIFNNDQPVLKDPQVRQALVLGTNRQGIISAVSGRGHLLGGPLPLVFVPGETAAQASFNREAAKAKLESVGWKLVGDKRQKNGVNLELSVVAPNSSDYKLILDALSEQWKAIGVTVKPQLADTETIASDYLQPRAYDVLLYELAVGADPDVYAYWHSSQANAKGLNFANYRSGLADDALSSARARLDLALRTAKYKTFYEQWVKDTPAIALYQPMLSYVTTQNSMSIEKDKPIIDAAERYQNITRWSVLQKMVYTTK